jgi:hypothetical protein
VHGVWRVHERLIWCAHVLRSRSSDPLIQGVNKPEVVGSPEANEPEVVLPGFGRSGSTLRRQSTQCSRARLLRSSTVRFTTALYASWLKETLPHGVMIQARGYSGRYHIGTYEKPFIRTVSVVVSALPTGHV